MCCLWEINMKALFLLFLILFSCVAYSLDKIELRFYGQDICLEIKSSIKLKGNFKNNSEDLLKFHEKVRKANYGDLMLELYRVRNEYTLNDWLYYDLLTKVSKILSPNSKNKATYFLWFLLGESGFGSRIAFNKKTNSVYCFIPVEQLLYDVLRIGEYYCLDSDTNSDFSFPRYNPYKNGKYCSFDFDFLPNFKKKKEVKRSFYINSKNLFGDSLEILFDENLIEAYSFIPKSSLINKFSTPLSATSMRLVDFLITDMKNVGDSIRAVNLMRFVIDNIKLGEDHLVFGKEDKWLSPDELLYYKVGDCEDRSALLFSLMKLIVGRPMIILSYPDEEHVNIAINLDIKAEPSIVWKEKKYFICEVTSADGFIPLGFYKIQDDLNFKVEGEYP